MTEYDCTCHRSLLWWIRGAWQMRQTLPFVQGVRAGYSLWRSNLKDRHS